MKVLILGGSGMLGNMLVDYLSQQSGIELSATVRTVEKKERSQQCYSDVRWRMFDAATKSTSSDLEKLLSNIDYCINAIGVTKPHICESSLASVARAIQINALFPYQIAKCLRQLPQKRLIQIATDCVYDGSEGAYCENATHTANDIYGVTKSLGEVRLSNIHHLRCSIIGPEHRAQKTFLLEWFLSKSREEINGFTNHIWTGLTTLHFAKICAGIIKTNLCLGHLQHIIPADSVSKYELLMLCQKIYGKWDLTIKATPADQTIDRTLSTWHLNKNLALWQAAGYSQPPTIQDMLEELADYHMRIGALC